MRLPYVSESGVWYIMTEGSYRQDLCAVHWRGAALRCDADALCEGESYAT